MDTLQVERADGVVTITFDRPQKKNAVNAVMWDELLEVGRQLLDDQTARCVVLTGAGGEFCSGADLSGSEDPTGGTRHGLANMQHIHNVVGTLHDLPMPTIAKVVGVAAGVGMSMALACDLVVAAEGARFSAIFARRGLSLDGGASWLLPRLVGMHKAKELALFADIIGAEDALALGLVNRVVPAADIDGFVADWAGRLASGPPIALAMTKRLLNRSFEQSFEQALDDESRCQAVNFATKDMREAVLAFVEKREPSFDGR